MCRCVQFSEHILKIQDSGGIGYKQGSAYALFEGLYNPGLLSASLRPAQLQQRDKIMSKSCGVMDMKKRTNRLVGFGVIVNFPSTEMAIDVYGSYFGRTAPQL